MLPHGHASRKACERVSESVLNLEMASVCVSVSKAARCPRRSLTETPITARSATSHRASSSLRMAFNLACPHENTALKWREGDKRFQCPKHDSKYTPEGVFTDGRATRNMDRLAIRRQGVQVIVGLDRLFKSDQNSTEWAAAVVTH